jgi:3-hydroxyisobutyrate dehydrogenase-like beta-hydroxyacid dehydrogenase
MMLHWEQCMVKMMRIKLDRMEQMQKMVRKMVRKMQLIMAELQMLLLPLPKASLMEQMQKMMRNMQLMMADLQMLLPMLLEEAVGDLLHQLP